MNAPRGRPFPAGNKQGRGRPKGSRNKARSEVQQLIDECALPLTRKCISFAAQGDRSAMRLLMDRISPARRDACIRMSLPSIRTAQDVDKAAEKVTQAIRRGAIAPVEGETMMKILEMRAGIIATAQLESRIGKLEAAPDVVSRGS